MPSKSSMEYLERKRLMRRPAPGGGAFETSASQLHARTIVPLPALLAPDTPRRRVLMQKQNERIPYQGDCVKPACDCQP